MIGTVRLIAVPIVLLLMLTNNVSGQWNSKLWKSGAYNTCHDFWSGKPSSEDYFPFQPATGLGIENQFKMLGPAAKPAFKYVWAVYQDTSIYLNIERIGMGNGFVRIPKPRAYNHFIGVPKDNISVREGRYQTASNIFGLFGLAGTIVGLGGAAVANAIDKPNKVDFVFNLETGQVNVITNLYMLQILEPYPKLYNAFLMDTETDKIDIILMYLELMNDAVEYGEN